MPSSQPSIPRTQAFGPHDLMPKGRWRDDHEPWWCERCRAIWHGCGQAWPAAADNPRPQGRCATNPARPARRLRPPTGSPRHATPASISARQRLARKCAGSVTTIPSSCASSRSRSSETIASTFAARASATR
jgi:hypothetical protein